MWHISLFQQRSYANSLVSPACTHQVEEAAEGQKRCSAHTREWYTSDEKLRAQVAAALDLLRGAGGALMKMSEVCEQRPGGEVLHTSPRAKAVIHYSA